MGGIVSTTSKKPRRLMGELPKSIDRLINNARAYRDRNSAAGLCRACGDLPEPKHKTCRKCIDRCFARYQRDRKNLCAYRNKHHADLKAQVFTHYAPGGKLQCACCGEAEPSFIQLDHLRNDGNEHRKRLGSLSSERLYRDIINRGFPPDFQLLCANCNIGKHKNGGTCPHQNPKT